MSRWSYFGAFLSIAILTHSLAAQNSAVVKNVSVRGTGEAMEVEIETAGTPVSPDTQIITGPDRIVVDFPGAIPAADLRALKVNRGVLKGVRSGLFFSNPPITRVVLDLTQPQSYQISSAQNAIVVKLGPATANTQFANAPSVGGAQLRTASLASAPNAPSARVAPARVSGAGTATKLAIANVGTVTIERTPIEHASMPAASVAAAADTGAGNSSAAPQANLAAAPSAVPAAVLAPAEALKPPLSVSYVNGMLTIHSEKATLAEVLFQVHQQTQAEIAIPAGAEQEQVVADLGPAPARDVLGALLNGSPYNFIFVGDELALERVILTRRDPNIF